MGKESNDYEVTPISSAFGRAFRVTKVFPRDPMDWVTYHVCLDGARSSCECKGHAAHGHCKHVDGLAALVERGKL